MDKSTESQRIMRTTNKNHLESTKTMKKHKRSRIKNASKNSERQETEKQQPGKKAPEGEGGEREEEGEEVARGEERKGNNDNEIMKWSDALENIVN